GEERRKGLAHGVADAVDRGELDGPCPRLAELLDRAEGLRQQSRRRLPDMASTELIDEAVELGLAARVDVGEELVETLVGPLLGTQHLLALLAGELLARP